MPRKLTQKQEAFVRNLFSGMSQYDAYCQAGYAVGKQKRRTIDSNASRLASNVKVLARWDELNKAADDEAVAKVIERKKILTEIMRGRFADFMVHLTEEKLRSAALQELRITEVSIGKKTKDEEEGGLIKKTTIIRLRDPIQAIAELNKMEGVYKMVAPVEIDSRTLNIVVTSEKTKELLEEIEKGIPPHGPSDD